MTPSKFSTKWIFTLVIHMFFHPIHAQPLKWELEPDKGEWVKNTLKAMRIEQKVGQLLAPAINPRSFENDPAKFEKVVEWIETYHIGHIYITGNRQDPQYVAQLINKFQEQADIPLLIHSDLECGPGDRFDGGAIFPPLMAVAQTRSLELAYEMAQITAIEARALGIHLINSPVCDVNLNPDNPVINIRSFGDDPQLVADFAVAYMRGLQENGLLGAAKHFPGHGDVSVDSHSKMPVIQADRQRLEEVELYPYKKAIAAGLMSMMTAHISVPALDPTPHLPATLSKPIMTDLFRREMGFKGIAITDAFDMGGLLDFGSFEESALQSIVAGIDIVLLWTNPRFEKVCPHILESLQNGSLSETRLDESVRRILEAKARLGLHRQKLVNIENIRTTVGIPSHVQKARKVYEKSIVLLRNENDLIPLHGQKNIAVFSINDDENHITIGKQFIQEIKSRRTATTFYADPTTPARELDSALDQAAKADIVIVGLFARVFARRGSAGVVNEQIFRFLRRLSSGETPVILVSFGSPYLIQQFPDVNGYMIATEPTWDFYGYNKCRPGQSAAAKALFGDVDITGKLAVTIPKLYPLGSGIVQFSKEDK